MDLQDPHFEELWNRFRTIVQSVADAQTLRDLAQKRAQRAQSNAEKLRQQANSDPRFHDDPSEVDPDEWQRRYEQEDAKAQVLEAMLAYFIAHETPTVPPPKIEEIEENGRAAMMSTYKFIGDPKKREVYTAIRRVLKEEEVPGGKIAFYKAADQKRGLTGKGRATENWVRDNEQSPLPDPDYWRQKFDL
ncbi:hypothetical protein GGP65_003278 [Salinibacter ruber]|uniref:hypothetical protein n=1 Tax=Salinibacter ruber TaxID=146919 RepID=UPI002169F662|nr:hypothetical protein [Salinibacter ruber]MCS3665634.1 hypothetical protein [Salinibacter ruber]